MSFGNIFISNTNYTEGLVPTYLLRSQMEFIQCSPADTACSLLFIAYQTETWDVAAVKEESLSELAVEKNESCLRR
jgi:hypothetical protein